MFQVDDAFTCVQFLCTFADFRNGQPCSLVVFYCLGPKMNWFPTSKVFTLEISPAWMTSWLTPTKPFVVQATYTVTTVLARWPQEYFAHSMFLFSGSIPPWQLHPQVTCCDNPSTFHPRRSHYPTDLWVGGFLCSSWRVSAFSGTWMNTSDSGCEKALAGRSSFPMHVGQRPKV